MRDSDWHIIYELHKTRNITKAADALFITQPTLTKRLQHIEDTMEIRIVNRSTKGVQFTREGEFLAEQAQIHVQFMEGIRKRLEEFKAQDYHTIRIVSSYTFGKYHLPDILAGYRECHKDAAFDVRISKSDLAPEFLTDGRCDIAFVRGEYDFGLNQRRLFKEQAYLISQKPISLSRLCEEDRVDNVLGYYTRKMLDAWWEERFPNQSPPIRVTAREVDICWEMVRKGLGYAIGFFDLEQMEKKELYCEPLFYQDGSPVERNTWLLYSQHYPESGFVSDFISYVESCYPTK